jgi:PAS domain S-box-containing protein
MAPGDHAAMLLNALLTTTHDAIAEISPEGLVSRWNPAAEQLYGYRAGDILGRPFALVAQGIPPPEPNGTPSTVEAVRRHRSGSLLDVEVKRVPLPQGWLDLSRDISARKVAHRNRHVHRAITEALFEARGLGDLLARFLETVGQTMDWTLGEIWVRDPAANALRMIETWHLPEARYERFAAYARSVYLPVGTGLPGRVWETGRIEWLPRLADSDFYVRGEAAELAGLRSGLGFPIRVHGEILGVAVFLCCAIPPPDESLTALLETLGAHLGRALKLHQGLAERDEQDRPFKLGFDAAPIGMALVDQLGHTVHANPALVRFLGYPKDDLVGRVLFDLLHPDDQGEAALLGLQLLDGERSEMVLSQRYVRSDGSLVEARCMASVLPDTPTPLVLLMLMEQTPNSGREHPAS